MVSSATTALIISLSWLSRFLRFALSTKSMSFRLENSSALKVFVVFCVIFSSPATCLLQDFLMGRLTRA